MPIIKAEAFMTPGSREWIEAARAVGRTRAETPPERVRSRVAPAVQTPPSAVRKGLRGIEATQDLDGLETKGRIIDRYL